MTARNTALIEQSEKLENDVKALREEIQLLKNAKESLEVFYRFRLLCMYLVANQFHNLPKTSSYGKKYRGTRLVLPSRKKKRPN